MIKNKYIKKHGFEREWVKFGDSLIHKLSDGKLIQLDPTSTEAYCKFKLPDGTNCKCPAASCGKYGEEVAKTISTYARTICMYTTPELSKVKSITKLDGDYKVVLTRGEINEMTFTNVGPLSSMIGKKVDCKRAGRPVMETFNKEMFGETGQDQFDAFSTVYTMLYGG